MLYIETYFYVLIEEGICSKERFRMIALSFGDAKLKQLIDILVNQKCLLLWSKQFFNIDIIYTLCILSQKHSCKL